MVYNNKKLVFAYFRIFVHEHTRARAGGYFGYNVTFYTALLLGAVFVVQPTTFGRPFEIAFPLSHRPSSLNKDYTRVYCIVKMHCTLPRCIPCCLPTVNARIKWKCNSNTRAIVSRSYKKEKKHREKKDIYTIQKQAIGFTIYTCILYIG